MGMIQARSSESDVTTYPGSASWMFREAGHFYVLPKSGPPSVTVLRDHCFLVFSARRKDLLPRNMIFMQILRQWLPVKHLTTLYLGYCRARWSVVLTPINYQRQASQTWAIEYRIWQQIMVNDERNGAYTSMMDVSGCDNKQERERGLVTMLLHNMTGLEETPMVSASIWTCNVISLPSEAYSDSRSDPG